MNIDLVNVSLELLPFQLFEHPEDNLDHAQLPSLARIDFIKSKFEFESFSDWSKTIDLVSQEVIFEDTRQKGNFSIPVNTFGCPGSNNKLPSRYHGFCFTMFSRSKDDINLQIKLYCGFGL